MQIPLFSVPYDSACRGERMGAGPLQLLKSGLAARLEAEGHCVTVRPVEVPAKCRATEIASTFELAAVVARGVAETVEIGALPLVVSGNCGPAALVCIGGLQGQTKIFWFDAHGDFNTPETTRSGFLDGMALAAVTGRCWARLASAIPGFRGVPERNVTAIGVRDLDEEEATAFSGVGHQTRRSPVAAGRFATDFGRAARYRKLAGLRPSGSRCPRDPIEGRMNEFAARDGLTLDT